MNPRNPSHSPFPHSPVPDSPSPDEANNNLAESRTQPAQQQQNLRRTSESSNRQVNVTIGGSGGGGVQPILSSSSYNLGRRKRARLAQETDILAAQPQFLPQNPQRPGSFLPTQPNQCLQQRSNLLPQPMQQSPWSQPLLPRPMQQSQRSQPLLPHPMQQSQRSRPLLPHPMQQSQRSRPLLLHPMKVKQMLPPPAQQRQCPHHQLVQQPLQQSQWGHLQQQRVMEQRLTVPSNMRSSYSNFLMEVMHCQWKTPMNNTVEFWRHYVASYYDSRAKERWCLSSCNDSRIPSRKDGNKCNVCSWTPQKGFDVSFGELPGRFKAKFDKALGERLDPGMGEEHGPRKGITVLVYPRATQRSIYERENIIYKGMLRIEITDQMKILAWEFCINERESFVPIQRPIIPSYSPDKYLLGIGEILRRLEAKNASDESPAQGSQRNNHMVQNAQPRVDENVFQTAGVTRQAKSQGNRIKHSAMNDTRAMQPSPTSQQNAYQISQEHVSIGIDAQTADLPNPYMELCMLRNAHAFLQQCCAEEQLISNNTLNTPNAEDTGQSSHMIIGEANMNVISVNEAACGTRTRTPTAAAAGSPVEPLETGMIPDPAMEEPQLQGIPIMENPANDHSPTNEDTMMPMVMNDLQLFTDQLSDNEIEMLLKC